ncbi:MAG TPA: lysozyme inhibitor LprI family protein [Rhizomicrobium sp.]
MTAALVLLASTGARAGDTVDCNNAMTQMDMNICADREYQRADKALGHAYTTAMSSEDGKGRELLRASERAWIAFRDAECTYEANASAGGSIQPMEYSNCLTELTKARTKQLGGK